MKMLVDRKEKLSRLSVVVAATLLASPPAARGQEAPLYNATTVAQRPDQMARNGLCDLHRMVEAGEIELRNALEGIDIHPGIFRYQLNKETGAIDPVHPGMGIQVLDEIARRAKFEWRNSFGVVDSPTENQTWGDVLDYTIDTYDIMGDWYLKTTERVAANMLFPEKWYDGSLIMVRKATVEDGSFDWDAFLRPFTPGVWWLIVGTTFFSGVVYYLIERFGSAGPRHSLSPARAIYENFLNLTGHYHLDPKDVGNWIHSFSFCFLALVLLATYTANLASFMVIRNTPVITINEIQDVIKNDLRLCLMDGSAAETFIREQFQSLQIVEKTKIVDSYLGLDADDCDVLLTTIDTWQSKKNDIVYNEDCTKEWVGRVVQQNDAGFILRDSEKLCSSLLRDVFTLHLMEMKRDKTFQKIWDTERAKSVTNNCAAAGASSSEDSGDNDEMMQLGVKNLGGIFIFHAVLLAVGVAMTVTNKLAPWQNKQGINPLRVSLARFSKHVTRESAVDGGSGTESGDMPENIEQGGGEDSSMGGETSNGGIVATDLQRKQMECIESIQKQVDAMQQQLTELTEQLKATKNGTVWC